MPAKHDQHSTALDRTIARETDLKRLLHDWIIGERGRLTVKALASATGYPLFSVYKHLDETAPNGLSFRDLDASIQADRDGLGAAILDALAEYWGVTWRRREQLGASAEDLRRLVAASLQTAAAVATQVLTDLSDGLLEPSEFKALRPQLEESIRQQQLLLASLQQAAEAQRPPQLEVI